MSGKYQALTILGLLLACSVLILAFWGTAKADLIIEPALPGNAHSFSSGFGTSFSYQYLGTGLSGTITAFEYPFQVITWAGALDAGGGQGFDIIEFSSEANALAYLANSTTTILATYSSTNNNYLSGTPGTYTWIWNGTEGNVDSLTFNPANYYVLSLRLFRGGTNDTGTARLFGTAFNSFGESCANATRNYSTPTPDPNPCSGTDINTLAFEATGIGNVYVPDTGLEPTWNEVISFIPSTGVNISVGTTTIGAEFSIPQPDFIEYIGYRLYSPTNEVLYEATTTPGGAGVYEISTDYNFTGAGFYEGHAYFAQNLGGEIWEVDSVPVQQINVDMEEWTITDSGQFTQNNATNSTSTLGNLTLDCGDGFTSSVCNLVARIMIPSATSIGGVQSSFQSIMAKAPFSFFTESHKVLSAFKTSGSTTGGSLSLTLYGAEADIISSEGAAAVGLGTTQINFIKFLIEVGLWILLAWFLYWRIASMFGS